MNRFLSKLDLRDIKIDPTGSRFPPDADDDQDASPAEASPKGLANGHAAAPVDDLEPVSLESPTQWLGRTSYNGVGEFVPDAPPVAPVAPPPPVEDVVDVVAATDIEGVCLSDDGDVLKVSARSRPSAVAGAIAGVVRLDGRAEVQAIGAGATNQAVKAVAIAREYLKESGIDAVCLPAFIDVTIDNEDRTAIRIVVEPR